MPRPIAQKDVQLPRLEFCKVSGAISLTFFSTLTTSLFSWAIAQPMLAQTAAVSGLDFTNSATRNHAKIPTTVIKTQYVSGSCNDGRFIPGPLLKFDHNGKPDGLSSSFLVSQQVDEGRVEAGFVSSKTPPAPGLRVVIRNLTRGMLTNPLPYSDREYDKGVTSEPLVMALSNVHNGRYLAVAIGNNNLTYEIKRKNEVVESGSFVVSIDRQITTKTETESLAAARTRCSSQNYLGNGRDPFSTNKPLTKNEPWKQPIFQPPKIVPVKPLILTPR
jgi:hypothetical protein